MRKKNEMIGIEFADEPMKALVEGIKIQTIRCTDYKLLPGQQVFVKESFAQIASTELTNAYTLYKADGEPKKKIYWESATHMDKKRSRCILTIKSIIVKYLQEITTQEFMNEGIEVQDFEKFGPEKLRDKFHILWNSLHADEAKKWEANPIVHVYKFSASFLHTPSKG